MRIDPADPERIYRSLRVRALAGGLHAGPAELPRAQLAEPAAGSATRPPSWAPSSCAWLKRALVASRATWKVIASDMPHRPGGARLNPDVPKGTYEAWANGDNGSPLGRELELADLLSFIKNKAIRTWCG